ncbi:alpha-L-glutamate ligase [Streptomyces sp. NRRL F-4489]|uniref:ATP-grasp domain-containing protein n=1 Tax=Streptomyces sp. NRRL F-4489 TaxID=1609095 RepID=UPI000748C4AD|nr:alpha-L-glutamate ligase [Streptomyces sp. NRRL F-4489]KUL49460.1 alpha-L-glutamate ligase [Streptomyces sp. NRRL F-4489]
MRVGIISADPGHPLLTATAGLLRGRGHRVGFLTPDGRAAAGDRVAPGEHATARGLAAAGEPTGPDAPHASCAPRADVYLLKARTPPALALAARLEAAGAPVVNSAAATAGCQDRAAMAETARAAGLPFAATVHETTLAPGAALAPGANGAATAPSGTLPPDLPFPLVLKSRHSRRGDLVARVDTPAELGELAATRPGEPVILQRFTANDGWDHKLWIVDGQLFAARRRSELSPGGRGPNTPLPVSALPAAWTAAALRAGEVFGLEVYGVDLLDAGDGTPLIVDVNAFPGIRGQAGAPEALAALALRHATTRPAPARPASTRP